MNVKEQWHGLHVHLTLATGVGIPGCPLATSARCSTNCTQDTGDTATIWA